MKIKVKRLHPDAVLPTRGSEYAAGYDLTYDGPGETARGAGGFGSTGK